MRWLVVLVVAVGLHDAGAAEACSRIGNPHFMPGDPVELVPPSVVTAGKPSVFRSDRQGSCPATTLVSIDVVATDDTTPTIELGYRLRIARGETPLQGFGDTSGDRLGGVLLIFFSGADDDLDFDLGISAVDKSGNVGPETVVPIYDEAPGCSTGGASSLILAFALLGLRRRRR
jgi:hypothetical protein